MNKFKTKTSQDRPLPQYMLHRLFALLCLLILSAQMIAAHADTNPTPLETLTQQRQALLDELSQYEKTLELLHRDTTRPEQSKDPAVVKLVKEATRVKKQLVEIAAQEVTLLQQRMQAANEARLADGDTIAGREDEEMIAQLAARTDVLESKPRRSMNPQSSLDQDAQDVERLHLLLEDYFTQLQKTANAMHHAETAEERELTQAALARLQNVPFSADKVHLNGAEGSTALIHMTKRLMNPAINDSRRDDALICSIKTYLFDTLVSSEKRSLRAVGKHNFIARLTIQPGDSTLSIGGERWEVSLPEQTTATDYVLTFHRPPGRDAELHIFAVDELLAVENPHLPTWLPEEMELQPISG